MNTEWSRPTRYIVAVALSLLGLYIFYLISRSVLTLLILAALIAFIVRPVIHDLHQRFKMPRALAVLFTYLGVVILFIIGALFLTPSIVRAIEFVGELDYGVFIDNSFTWIIDQLIVIRDIQIPLVALDDYVDQTITSILPSLENASTTIDPDPPPASAIIQSIGSAITVTFGVAAGLVGSVLSSIVLFIFMILASIHMSLGAPAYREHVMRLIPTPFHAEITILFNRIGHIWVAFFRGQIILMVIMGVTTWLGLTLLGVPGAISLGIIAGLLEVIPNFGPVIAAVPAVIVALLQGSTYLPVNNLIFVIIVILFYWLLQNMENSILVPRVLGEAVNLPPLVVMTGVLVAASVGGILGALLATPIIAAGREIVHYAYRKILGVDPFPDDNQSVASTMLPPIKEVPAILPELQPASPAPVDPAPNRAVSPVSIEEENVQV